MTKAEVQALIDASVKTQVAAQLGQVEARVKEAAAQEIAALTATEGTGDNPSAWAKSDTVWAKENGIFQGDGEGNYGWQKALTREQLAAVERRMLEKFLAAMEETVKRL